MKQEVEQDGIGDGTNCCFIMCDVCELAPAAVTCKVDAAALCVACDHDIHSANPLAARHHRVRLNQFDHCATTKTTGSWILGTNSFADQYHQERKSVDLFSLFEDQFVGLDCYQLISPSSQTYDGDGVVPVQTPTLKPPPPRNTDRADLPENRFESTKFTTSNVDFSFLGNSCYGVPSLSHTVSSSSMDVGVVPDGSSLSDITNPFTKPGLSSSAINRHQGSQEVVTCTATDREARVLRYKEKRKNRKFEKTIRYASRKAYAESRPRIKGRFAKRSTDYSDDHQWDSDVSTTTGIFSSHDACYGVVRSFPESTTTTCSISNFQYRGF